MKISTFTDECERLGRLIGWMRSRVELEEPSGTVRVHFTTPTGSACVAVNAKQLAEADPEYVKWRMNIARFTARNLEGRPFDTNRYPTEWAAA